MIVKKATMLDFYQIRLTHNQSILNMAFLVVKHLGIPDNVGYCAIYQTEPLAETECIYGYNSGHQMRHKRITNVHHPIKDGCECEVIHSRNEDSISG
ncbi:MAG TPA: hypothetical protein VE843_14370 [Ktedonobacteraceae bacterium]|nr:hypothetical protein [Ktedonobacteraceae bacterium]